MLYIENREYLKGITQGHGARIDIHFPGTIPDPHGQGFYVSSGFETDIALQVVRVLLVYVGLWVFLYQHNNRFYCTPQHWQTRTYDWRGNQDDKGEFLEK